MNKCTCNHLTCELGWTRYSHCVCTIIVRWEVSINMYIKTEIHSMCKPRSLNFILWLLFCYRTAIIDQKATLAKVKRIIYKLFMGVCVRVLFYSVIKTVPTVRAKSIHFDKHIQKLQICNSRFSLFETFSITDTRKLFGNISQHFLWMKFFSFIQNANSDFITFR